MTLKIKKQKREGFAVKPCNIYVETHEKLASLSNESGVSIVKLIALLVDYALDNVEIIENELSD